MIFSCRRQNGLDQASTWSCGPNGPNAVPKPTPPPKVASALTAETSAEMSAETSAETVPKSEPKLEPKSEPKLEPKFFKFGAEIFRSRNGAEMELLGADKFGREQHLKC